MIKTESTPVLYIFSGLPASGKTTLSKSLARSLGAVYLRIDTVEQGLRELCKIKVEGEGYRLSYRLAQDNLRLGNSVIADSCNPIVLTREEWRQVARDVGATFVDIEVFCSDVVEHRQRAEAREATVPNLVLPTWEKIVQREYHTWYEEVIRIDTAEETPEQSFAHLLEALGCTKRINR